MPAPSRARAMNPPRQISASTPLYSASPPQTPPSTRLVLLRYRCGRGGTAARVGGSAVGGSAVGGSAAGGSGLGGAVMPGASPAPPPPDTEEGPDRVRDLRPGPVSPGRRPP